MYLTERPSLDRNSSRDRRQHVAGTVILMGLVSMFTDISSESVNAILPLYLTALVGLGPLAYGFIDGIYQGVSALVRILGGWVADRSDRPKWIAFFGYGLSALTRLALLQATSLSAITTVITADRLGKGVRTAPRDAIITATSDPQSLGRAFGVHRSLDTLGAVLGPLVAFAILAQTPGDYHSVFIVSFGAAVVGLAILLLIVPDIRPRRRARAAEPTAAVGEAPENAVTAVQPAAPRPSLKMLASRNFALLAAATGLLGVLTIGDGFLYLALQRRDDLAIKYFPLLYVGTNIAYMLLAIPFGRLADRIGRVKVFIGGHLGLLLAYLCAGGPFSGTALTLACLALLGVYYAATDGVLAAIASRISPVGAKASGIATVQTVQASARFFASLGFGLVWSLFGQRTALLSVSMVFVVAVPIAWTMLRTTERQFGQPGALAHG